MPLSPRSVTVSSLTSPISQHQGVNNTVVKSPKEIVCQPFKDFETPTAVVSLPQNPLGDKLLQLFSLVKEGNVDEAASVLDAIGAEKARDVKDSVYGNSLLHQSCINGDMAMTQLLLSKGCDMEALNESGASPLHVAMMYYHRELTQFLIENNADVNARDNNGLSPLHRAMRDGDRELISLLLSYGADDNLVSITRKRPLSIGKVYGNAEITDNYDIIKMQALASPKGNLKKQMDEEMRQKQERENARRKYQEAVERVEALEKEVTSLHEVIAALKSGEKAAGDASSSNEEVQLLRDQNSQYLTMHRIQEEQIKSVLEAKDFKIEALKKEISQMIQPFEFDAARKELVAEFEQQLARYQTENHAKDFTITSLKNQLESLQRRYSEDTERMTASLDRQATLIHQYTVEIHSHTVDDSALYIPKEKASLCACAIL
jgi:hypothetical protein